MRTLDFHTEIAGCALILPLFQFGVAANQGVRTRNAPLLAAIAHEDYLISAVMAIEYEWGSVPAFAERGLGIEPDTILAFRAAMI